MGYGSGSVQHKGAADCAHKGFAVPDFMQQNQCSGTGTVYLPPFLWYSLTYGRTFSTGR